MTKRTSARMRALRWLWDRGGDGGFDLHGIAFARGETAPFQRGTWNALRSLGLVEFYELSGRTYRRLRVTPSGAGEAARLDEAASCDG